MPSLVVFGAQWGDEGKGRFVDYLASQSDIVVRFQGGNNAGHTVVHGDKTYALHLLPSGVLTGKTCLIGNGVVVDVKALLDEIAFIESEGFSADKLVISPRAHVVMPYHILLDRLSETQRGTAIGTTAKGIGPCYTDKAERCGIRVCDLISERFPDVLKDALESKNELLVKLYEAEPLDYQAVLEEYSAYAERIRKYVAQTDYMVYDAYKSGRNILFEGAQGAMLDLDYGTYPFVTSSHPTAGGVCIGAGIGPNMVDRVLGIVKAYTTRVGNGPFITELIGKTGEELREKGHEYGVTTGRPRRCGWLDMVIVNHAARIGGITDLAITRMDTLGGFPMVKICTHYEYEGKPANEYFADLDDIAKCTPVYQAFKGWDDNLSGIKRFEDLPENARIYIEAIEEFSGLRVAMIGVGAEKEQCIARTSLW